MDNAAEIIPRNIEDEMRSSYLDYAMSVIIGRAIPDVRDGLKPVHRRILYAMYSEGLLSTKRFSKCAGVVGEVLKKYHPHGDAAVYDTLVRMAQEWNLRYPLIHGQGNFGCFTGETRVRLADGTSRSFLELVKDGSEGRPNFIYTINADGGIRLAPIRAPRLTKKDSPIVCVTLDNGMKIRCTPDHRFMLRDGTYREAQMLVAGESLMPFYSRPYGGRDADLKGYEEVYDPAGEDTWFFAHRLADEYNIMIGVYPRSAGRVRHHKDFNSNVCASHHGKLNHKVISVERAGSADVYDLSVDGTHNFALEAGVFVHNSVDGDSAAAYRYTEAKLYAIAEELLADIDKETVDFGPNFDGTTLEPLVLPSKLPNLLINGSDGIAVGMATKIPPHNLGEIIDGCVAVIDNPNVTVKELMKFIPGPDFPTGAFINGKEGIKSAYETGRGQLQMRARAAIEQMAKGDRECIVINEIPYQVNKARLVERIAELVQNGKIEGISDIRDESDRDGMRIVIELKRGVVAAVILNQLFAHTSMQSGFGIILLAIVGGQPRLLNLKDALTLFIEHRKEVITRRTAYELRKAMERAHILEGLKIAVENIDDVVALIKKSKEPQSARMALMNKYELSEIQAQAILEMRLQRLTGLERDKIVQEYKDIQKFIGELKAILADEKLIYKIIREDLAAIKEKYGDARRTVIQVRSEDLSVEDLIQEEEMVVTVSHRGFIKRNPISIYRSQRRGGKGKQGATLRDEDFVEDLFITSTHNYVLIFSKAGKVYWLKVHEIPQMGRVAKGQAITNLVHMSGDDSVAAILPVREFKEGQFIVMATRAGVIKKTDLMAYSNPRAGGIIATTIDEGDELISVRLTNGSQQIFLTTKEGQAIRFNETDVRSMGRTARGVRGISLGKGDALVGMEVLTTNASILTVTALGYGKRSPCDEYRVQSRGGSGIITLKVTDKNGPVVSVMQVTDADDVMLVTDGGKVIRSCAKEISTIGRNTQGVRLISLDIKEKVVSVAKLAEQDDEE